MGVYTNKYKYILGSYTDIYMFDDDDDDFIDHRDNDGN